MYAVTSSMKGTICRRFANMVCKKVDVKVCRYSSHALDMNLNDTLNKIRDRTPSSIFSVNSRRNLNPPTRNLSTAAASFVGDTTSATTTSVLPDSGSSRGVARIGEAKKATKIETNVSVKINLNGSGVADSDSGIPLIDEMLQQFASHGLFDVHVKATGDRDVDERITDITNENVGHAIGTALQDAVGDNKDLKRIGSFFVAHHDALIHAALDLSGHSHLDFDKYIFRNCDDDVLVEPFFDSLVDASGMTLHLRHISGSKSLHIIEATFKAFAGALRQAIEYDPCPRPLLLGEGKKETKRETNVSVKINLNGSGVADSDSGIPFLDEMLHEFASHGMFDVHVKATGDRDVDERLTNEEVAHAIGTALQDVVRDKKEYINRIGSFSATHHDAVIQGGSLNINQAIASVKILTWGWYVGKIDPRTKLSWDDWQKGPLNRLNFDGDV